MGARMRFGQSAPATVVQVIGLAGLWLGAACGGRVSKGSGSGVGSGSPGSTTLTQPCDDGTGNEDCCPSGALDSMPCDAPPGTCWTRCDFASQLPGGSGGTRSEMSCIGGAWVSGHGLFSCEMADSGEGGSDGGSVDEGGSDGEAGPEPLAFVFTCPDGSSFAFQLPCEVGMSPLNVMECFAVGDGARINPIWSTSTPLSYLASHLNEPIVLGQF